MTVKPGLQPPQRRHHYRLWVLLGLSLLLHMLVFGSWKQTHIPLEFALQPPSFSVSLEALQVAAAQPQQQPPALPAKTAKKKVVHRQTKTTAAPAKTAAATPAVTENNTAQQLSRVAAATAAATPAKHANQPALNRARIISRLRRDLAQHFYYPPMARRRNIQGTVVLGFDISYQGTIHNINIVKSSGYAILDLAAEDAIQRLHRVDWIHDWFKDNDMNFEIPVIYRLTEN